MYKLIPIRNSLIKNDFKPPYTPYKTIFCKIVHNSFVKGTFRIK